MHAIDRCIHSIKDTVSIIFWMGWKFGANMLFTIGSGLQLYYHCFFQETLSDLCKTELAFPQWLTPKQSH